MLRALSKQYKVVVRCLQHNHERCYMRNRKLTADQEARVMKVMENSAMVERFASIHGKVQLAGDSARH